jgi:hypothetical protein
MLDHALTGEGAWTFWRRWKPSAMDTMAAGWSPLRWCLDVTPAVSFPGGEVELNLSLANEDVLLPGSYTARVAIVGPERWRWQRSVDVAVHGGRGPLAVAVLVDQVVLDGVPGQYRCAASLGTAAAPAAGRATIDVVGHPAPLTPRRRAGALGFSEAELSWLAGHGLDIVRSKETFTTVDLLLVGHASELDEDNWRGVSAAVDRGATALVLNPWELIAPGETSVALPFATPISCTSFRDWLYHKECFATAPDLVEGLAGPGLMDWRRFGPVLPRHLLQGDADKVAAFAAAVGFPCPGGYASGLLAASFRQERGQVVISTFDLLAHLGSLAVADHLTTNLLQYATS